MAVCPRQESSDAASAASAAGGRGDPAAAERTSAAPGKGGGSARRRDEREANGSARDTMRAIDVPAWCGGRSEGEGVTERGREEGFGGVVCLARIPVSTEALFAYFHWMELEKKINFFYLL